MKTVTGRVISDEPISLSKAATILSGFVSSENEATQDVSAYLRRASAAFTELKNFHREIRSVKPKSEAGHERNLTDELEEVSLAKRIDDLVENGEKIRSRESETVTLEEAIRGREQDEVKEHKKEKKKKKSKENKEEDVVDEKVNVKLEEEQSDGERKESKKKKKSKKNKEEDVIDEKVNVKLEEEQRSEERKERKKEKKKRKSDGEICSEERKSKKKRKSKEIEG